MESNDNYILQISKREFLEHIENEKYCERGEIS